MRLSHGDRRGEGNDFGEADLKEGGERWRNRVTGQCRGHYDGIKERE